MERLPEKVVRQSYREQAQLYQAHRWVTACLSEPSQALASQLVVEDAQLSIDGVPETAGTSPVTQISDLRVNSLEPSVETNVLRIEGGCAVQTNKLSPCTIDLEFRKQDLDFPLIAGVQVTRTKETVARTNSASNTIMRSRVLALKHRWHALVEHPVKRTEPFREIVAEGFKMDWGRGSLTGFDELSEWVESTAAIAASRHDIALFDCRATDTQEPEQHYTAHFEFAWSGISQDGQPMQAESEHRWLVVDDPSARFARIKQMDVKFKVPFHVVCD